MDTIAEIKYQQLLLMEETNDLCLHEMEIEGNFVRGCLESNIILLEEDTNEQKKTVTEKYSELWDKIIEMINILVEKFRSKTNELFDANIKWYEKNKDALAKVHWDKMMCNAIPYWDGKISDTQNVLNDFKSLFNNIPEKDMENYSTEDQFINNTVINKYLPSDKEKRIDDALLALFSIGDKNGDVTVVKENITIGNDKYKTMVDYITKYRDTVNNVTKWQTELKTQKGRIESILKRREQESVGEGFCSIENLPYASTELVFCENATFLFEADNDNKQSTSPTVTNTEKPDNTNDNNVSNPVSGLGDNRNQIAGKYTTQTLKYLQIACNLYHRAMAIAMTSYQKRYSSYISILKQCISESNPDSQETKQEES